MFISLEGDGSSIIKHVVVHVGVWTLFTALPWVTNFRNVTGTWYPYKASSSPRFASKSLFLSLKIRYPS